MIVRAAETTKFAESAAEGPAERRATKTAARASEPRRPWMSKTAVNFILDASLLVFMVLMLFTAAALRFVFPAPTLAAGWTLWGFGYDAWANFQFGLVAFFGLAILLHVMLHWSWVCCVFAAKVLRGRSARPDEGMQTIWGVGLLIVVVNVIGLLLGLAYLMVQAPVT